MDEDSAFARTVKSAIAPNGFPPVVLTCRAAVRTNGRARESIEVTLDILISLFLKLEKWDLARRVNFK